MAYLIDTNILVRLANAAGDSTTGTLVLMADSAKPSDITLSPEQAREEVITATPVACQEINKFSEKVFKTRGGRMGSGMGVLLEALWAYYVDQGRPARVAGNEGWEIG